MISLLEYAGGGVGGDRRFRLECGPLLAGRLKRKSHRLMTMRTTTTGTTTPMAICAASGSPTLVKACDGLSVDGVDVGVASVATYGELVPTVDEEDRVVDTNDSVVDLGVVVGAAEGSKVVGDMELVGLMQNGAPEPSPAQVWPSAQHIDPHWKSPTAQTLEQLAPSPEAQQTKAPLSNEHVSPASPMSWTSQRL